MLSSRDLFAKVRPVTRVVVSLGVVAGVLVLSVVTSLVWPERVAEVDGEAPVPLPAPSGDGLDAPHTLEQEDVR